MNYQNLAISQGWPLYTGLTVFIPFLYTIGDFPIQFSIYTSCPIHHVCSVENRALEASAQIKHKWLSCVEEYIAFLLTWSLTQFPTHLFAFYWFRLLSSICNLLATNGEDYDNSRLSRDIYRQITEKWLHFTDPSCTKSQNGLTMETSVKLRE